MPKSQDSCWHLYLATPACGLITVAFVRRLSQCGIDDVAQVANHQAKAHRRWKLRMCTGMEHLREAYNEGRVQRPIAELSQRMRGLPKKELVNNGF